jgi:hypothetical protein
LHVYGRSWERKLRSNQTKNNPKITSLNAGGVAIAEAKSSMVRLLPLPMVVVVKADVGDSTEYLRK